VVVSEELPTLAQQKADLIVSNAAMNKELYDIESEILNLLSNSTGNILDDTALIDTLAQVIFIPFFRYRLLSQAEPSQPATKARSDNKENCSPSIFIILV
jgi:dynein heavy chain